MKSVLVLGGYVRHYSRVQVLFQALKSKGYRIREWNIRCNWALRYLRFLIYSPRIIRDAVKSQFILVPYPGWTHIFYAKVISMLTRRKLVFDAFISNYNTYVEDRKYADEKSLRAIYYWLLDSTSVRISNAALLDTNVHISYFSKLIGVPKRKFIRVFVGHDAEAHASVEDIEKKPDQPVLFFYGSFSPLQGGQFILKALNILRSEGLQFHFILIGGGQEADILDSMIKEFQLEKYVERHPYIPFKELLSHMKRADIALGIFGATRKARRVIPNKVYDYAAMNLVFITGESIAMRELFESGVDYVGCSFGDETALADSIRTTIHDFDRLSQEMNPRKKLDLHATPDKIGAQLLKDLKEQSS